MPREVELDRFTVKTDEGKEYIIIQYQEYIQDRNSDAETVGLKRLATSEELHVHYIDPKTFKIFETGEIVRRI
ncbi:MAG: hypothetical protein NTZ34_00030 [Chloroflexi bacterium]|nr:hypothetical protein [Chloroflexota bacterium]